MINKNRKLIKVMKNEAYIGKIIDIKNTSWKEKDWKEPKLEERLNPNRTTLILSIEKNSTINSTINVNEFISKIKSKYPELKDMYLDIIKLMLEDKYITQDKIANKLEDKDIIKIIEKTLEEKMYKDDKYIGNSEEKYYKDTADGKSKFWHVYTVIAQKNIKK